MHKVSSFRLGFFRGSAFATRSPLIVLCILAAAISVTPPANAQRGTPGGRTSTRPYGVNLTYAVYQFDRSRSGDLQEITRIGATFSTPDEEIAHLKKAHKLEEVALRHIRSVGLRDGESFSDAVLLGPEYMTFSVAVQQVMRGFMKLDFRARYANEAMLDVKALEFENYETVLLRGGNGMFGLMYFIGAGGRQDSAPVERTLIVTVTPEIVPVANLRDRPDQLSHPVDEYGAPIKMDEDDLFTPPVTLERTTPKFDTGRVIRGTVLLGGTVTPEGKVINVKVLRSLDPALDERASAAFRRYRFSPALLNGRPVYATYREEVGFSVPESLNLEEETDGQRTGDKQSDPKRRRRP